MDLLQNPFHVLAASPRDNRRRIMELADERSLLLDSDECMKARSALTNPRKRLVAEIAWFPGIGQKRINELLSLLEASPAGLLAVDNLPLIAHANILVAGLSRLPEQSPIALAKWILDISTAFESVDSEKLSAIISEERAVSGFPEELDISAVDAEIQERREYYRKIIKSALDDLPPRALVKSVTIAVDVATKKGEINGPVLIADLVDSYEVEAQDFLNKEEENIKTLIEKLRAAVMAKVPDSGLSTIVNQLIQVVKNWDTVAQPIQVSTKGRGLDHIASRQVANHVRELIIYIFQKHDKLKISKQLTKMLQEVFAEVVKVADITAEDASALDSIAEKRVRSTSPSNNDSEEWRYEITYEAELGIIFKTKLRISPEGIEWGSNHWELDSITRIRWGGVSHSVNGIPSGTTYTIFFGNDSSGETIELKNEEIYNNFIDRLWRAVGVRLLTDYLSAWGDGKSFCFASAEISDQGMTLVQSKFFGGNERFFYHWKDLNIWQGPGVFYVGKRAKGGLAGTFSYLEDDNAHVLGAAVRMLMNIGGHRMSELLGKGNA